MHRGTVSPSVQPDFKPGSRRSLRRPQCQTNYASAHSTPYIYIYRNKSSAVVANVLGDQFEV